MLVIFHACELKLGTVLTQETSSLNCHRHQRKLLDDGNNVTDHQCYLCKCHVHNDGIAQMGVKSVNAKGNFGHFRSPEWHGNGCSDLDLGF